MIEFTKQIRELVTYILNPEEMDEDVIENYTDTVMLACEEYHIKQLKLYGVVFNEAKTINKQTQRKLIEQIMKADEELGLYSEVELVCNRINNFDNNRCINCGAKAGQKCEKQTN